MNIAICDPIQDVLKSIKEQIQNISCIEEIELYSNIKFFFEDIREGKFYDVVLMELDWESDKTGIDHSGELYSYNTGTKVIYMTSNASEHIEEVILKSSNLGGFLIKPIKNEILIQVLDKITEQIDARENKLIIRYKGSVCAIPIDDILYIESRLHKVNIVLNRITYQCNERLDQIYERLNHINFVQCHKSYAVNIKHICSYKRSEMVLDNGMLIPISKNRYAEVRKYLEKRLI